MEVIKSFEDKMTEELFHGIHSHAVHKKLNDRNRKAIERKLDLLNCAESLESLKLIPSHKPDAPVRDGQEKYSIPIDDTLWLAFKWTNGEAFAVEVKF